MSIFEWVVLGWLAGLTLWLWKFKRGPQGPKGDPYERSHSDIDSWRIRDASLELIDDSEYMTKIIQKINSYQLHGGAKIEI